MRVNAMPRRKHLMRPELAHLIDRLTCPRCQGEGVLHSRAVKYVNEPAWHTHRTCDVCEGSGINPAAFAALKDLVPSS